MSGGNFSRRSRSNARVPLFPTDASFTKVSPCIPITHTSINQTLIARLLTEPEILGDRMAIGNILILFGGRFLKLESRPKLSYSLSGERKEARNTLWCRWYGHALVLQGKCSPGAGRIGARFYVSLEIGWTLSIYLPWMDEMGCLMGRVGVGDLGTDLSLSVSVEMRQR